MTWPITDPLVVSTQPTLGPPLFQLTPPRESSRDVLLDLELRVRALDAEVTRLSAHITAIEIDRARPWWGVRAWRACVVWLQQLIERI